ncbi:PREDICTED: pleckstrin homology domain-containing family D member 1-like [Priapulus caudatus]|uniref:Pleckstrin homology domain-containing family D member 1-like n=1 Tax=Priapulus caudatus TaxID=37621 RepID=A0ABM1EPY8_PRICU|nr:PREDICTED: pleckstrin homology domain-containing family D member 1-like [Priapulus caudatus]
MPREGNGTSPDSSYGRNQLTLVLSLSHSLSFSQFFVVKDGFLLYYPESEKKDFERKRAFNIHPKGVIPLGNVTVESLEEINQEYCIHIKFESGNYMALAAETAMARNKWVEVLTQASRVTLLNTKLSENMIEELEMQGLQFCKEREDYHCQLQSETVALRDEITRNEELARVTLELEQEKQKMEEATLDLQGECERIKSELEDANDQLQGLETERTKMKNLTSDLNAQLEALRLEKENTLSTLHRKAQHTQQLSQENESLAHATQQLRTNLRAIEERITTLSHTKEDAEETLRKNEEMAEILTQEKHNYREQAQELVVTLNELMEQKQMTERDLKDEIEARMDAERRLHDAEQSLRHLEGALFRTRESITSETKCDMMTDVKKLKQFFENVATEAQIDANKPIIMKNAVYARKNFVRRAKTLRAATLRRYKSKSMGQCTDRSRLAAELNLEMSI